MLDADSAEKGVDIAEKCRPDIILMDIQLPGMDGFSALLLLRDNPLTRDIPVIAISANAMVHDIERGKAAGFDDYLTKPVDIRKFFAILDYLLPSSPETKA